MTSAVDVSVSSMTSDATPTVSTVISAHLMIIKNTQTKSFTNWSTKITRKSYINLTNICYSTTKCDINTYDITLVLSLASLVQHSWHREELGGPGRVTIQSRTHVIPVIYISSPTHCVSFYLCWASNIIYIYIIYI